MGGSGGGFFHDPIDTARKLRDAEQEAQDQKFDSEITSNIGKLLTDINERDTEAIQRHLKTIRDAIQSDIDGFINLRYGGSVAKHTYVDGLSDVDSLALINSSELSNKGPEEVKEYFYQRLKQRFPNTEIRKGDLAITLKFSDKEIQILPALKRGNSYKIASLTGRDKWTMINPNRFALSLRATNQKMSGKLVPMIKLAKSIISNLPSSRQLSGYHTEALAIECFSRYSGDKNTKAMLKHFFQTATKHVLNPLQDKTGQSTHVDDYLGSKNSINRKMVSDSLAQVGRKMQNADAARSKRSWQEILGVN